MVRSAPVWLLVATAVLVQIVYPLTPESSRNAVTVLSVVAFAAASLADVLRLHGIRGFTALVVVAGGGGLAVETLGVRTGFPFGAYTYAASLGPQLLGVPVVVPLAWMMMAWPALVVGRTLMRSAGTVALVGGAALATWDVFLDPQMVDAGHWRWVDPEPALPLVPGVPLTNFAGWAMVAVVMVGLLHRAVGGRAGAAPSGPATALFLWTYASSVVADVAFFDRPGSALAGGLLMGAVAVPFAVTSVRMRTRTAGHPHPVPAGHGVTRSGQPVTEPDAPRGARLPAGPTRGFRLRVRGGRPG